MPLRNACRNGDKTAVEAALLFDKKINLADANGMMPLHLICQCKTVSEDDALYIVNKLLDYGADLNAVTLKAQNTPLHIAAMYGKKRVVERLLAAGALLESQNKEGMTSLGCAVAFKENVDVIIMLIQHNANIETKSFSNTTRLGSGKAPIHFSVQNGLVENFIALATNGANIFQTTEDDFTIIELLGMGFKDNPEKFTTFIKYFELEDDINEIKRLGKQGFKFKSEGVSLPKVALPLIHKEVLEEQQTKTQKQLTYNFLMKHLTAINRLLHKIAAKIVVKKKKEINAHKSVETKGFAR